MDHVRVAAPPCASSTPLFVHHLDDLWLRADGFAFSPYQLLVAMPPLPLALVIAAHDDCAWDSASHELIDTIRLRLFGVPVGRMVMRLRPSPAPS